MYGVNTQFIIYPPRSANLCVRLEMAARVSLRWGAPWHATLHAAGKLPMLLLLSLGLLPSNQPPRGTIGRAERSKRRAVGDETVFDITNRFDGFFALLDALRRSGLRTEIKPGDAVIPTKDLEAQNIIAAQSYELQSVWYQGVDGAEVERCPVDSLDSRAPPGKESPSSTAASSTRTTTKAGR